MSADPHSLIVPTQLRDTMLKSVSRSKPTPIDIYEYANRVTLDVIGAAGFGYEANATELGKDSELFDSFNRVFGSLSYSSFYGIFTRFFPALDIFVSGNAPRRFEQGIGLT
jgi:cytochrome P450